jgi:glycosyltransferase involved in cell wall biosynthesis
LPPFVLDEEVTPARRERSATCVMVANYFDDPRKNLDLAIEAVGRVRAAAPDLRLILVGGWLSAERRAALPDFCETTGRLRPPEVARVLQGAGCCLLPSVWEEFGYAGLEALANGAPLVCGPLPAFADLSSGVFVSKSLEPHDFAEAIDRARSSAGFEFPPECRASSVLPALVGLYETVSAGS